MFYERFESVYENKVKDLNLEYKNFIQDIKK